MKIKISSILLAVITAITFAGCGNNQKNAQHNDQPAMVTDNTHNSRNSLDYQGTYTGTMPCADCSGIYTEITLTEDSYTMKTVYEGKGKDSENTFTDSGSYTWDSNGNIITLGNDSTNRYQVGENALYALDMDGNQITGDLADMYILKKK